MCQVFRLYLLYQSDFSPFEGQFLVFYMITTLQYQLHVVLFLSVHSVVVDNSFNLSSFSSDIL